MNSIKKIIIRLLGKDYQRQLESLRNRGAEIGDVMISGDVVIDQLWPFLLHIGNNTHITNNVTILNHDYSWSVLKRYDGTLTGGVAPVYIGDNVFIGNGAIILMGSHIGDNSIVAAGSVCTGKFSAGSVIGGNPAKVICSLDEYKQKRVNRQIEELKNIVRYYRKAYNTNPPKELFPAYSWLFEPRTNDISDTLKSVMKKKGNFEESMYLFMNSQPMFNGYSDFLQSVE